MVEKMRAMVLSELGPIETNPLKLTEIDRHEIQRPNELLIKIEACGVCHSQLHGIEGDWKVLGESLKGGYAEYLTVAEDFATKIPETMRPEYAAPLFCAGITAYKAVKASEPSKNKKIGIFGIGGVGHMAVQFAILEGADVIAISRNKKHLEIAKKLG